MSRRRRTGPRLASDLKEIVGEQYEFRELLYQMTRRDLLLRYKQTVMGFGWAIFMPLVNTAVFSVIFTRVAPLETGMPYPLFAYCGLLAWNFSASSFRFAVTSLTSNANLVTKVYFPREIFPISAVLVSLVDFASARSVLVGLMVYYQVAPTGAIVGAAGGVGRPRHVHAQHQPAARDGQPLLPRCQVPVRADPDDLDVSERGALPGRRRSAATLGTDHGAQPDDADHRGLPRRPAPRTAPDPAPFLIATAVSAVLLVGAGSSFIAPNTSSLRTSSAVNTQPEEWKARITRTGR